ncbi:hypothetical protein CBW65_04350 [Tumebacillus avium]|uniref:Uncharacterized protein n=1 Tax=Tumebacillus avium TaxID=1903704 RepID=A0A1Y0IIQ3_9BACL|nr:glycosyltransferase family 4 protein [Tumebacillus avium]ARU60381.1 hypothetical protein CBW65_04350 [Tumebacillus avium]
MLTTIWNKMFGSKKSVVKSSRHESSFRVLRLTPHYYYPQLADEGWPIRFDPIGGMQVQISQLSESMLSHPVEQTVMTLGLPNVPKHWRYHDRLEVFGAGLPMLPIKSEIRGTVGLNQYWGIGTILKIIKLYTTGQRKWDLLHSHCSGVLTPLVVGVVASKLLRVPLVFTIHCSRLATYHPMSRLDGWLHPLIIKLEKVCLRRAQHVITLTPRVRTAYLQENVLPPSRISVISDAVDPKTLQSFVTSKAIEEFHEQYKVPLDKNIILFVGRVAHEKGWFHFVDLAKRLQEQGEGEFHFLICGDGNHSKKLRKRVQDAGLENSFSITGFISHEKIPVAMKMAKMVVVPSLHEELGGTVLESVSMQVPVLAFAVGGIPNIIEHRKSGWLVEYGDLDGLVEGANWILQHPEQAEAMSRKALEVLEEYEIESIVEKHVQLYRLANTGTAQTTDRRLPTSIL